MDERKAEDLVRRLAVPLRGIDLYSPTHPLAQRGIDALSGAAALEAALAVVIGFVGDEAVVNAARVPRGLAALVGFRDRHGEHSRAVVGAVDPGPRGIDPLKYL